MPEPSVADRLRAEPFAFDFFQAVRLLRRLAGDAAGPVPAATTVRFAAHASLAFPASAVHDLEATPGRPPRMTVTFLGLTGPSGVLPRHYTELLLNQERFRPADWNEWTDDRRERWKADRRVVREWFDLFNHRATALFYAAWEKYRLFLPFERGEPDRDPPDAVTRALLSLVGLGTGHLRNRLAVAVGDPPEPAVRADDLAVLRFAGAFAQQHRSAWGLAAVLSGYFGRPVRVEQFRGQWLTLDDPSRTRLPDDETDEEPTARLGVTAVIGDRVWDVQGRFRLVLGPLTYAGFLELLPDPSPVRERKAFFLLSQLVRLYAGPEFDFDVQLVLAAAEVPACRLDESPGGPRLGWNAWLRETTPTEPAADAVFDGDPATAFA